jgi:hypothetical protein
MYAKMMVALVQGHGHEVWDEDLSNTRAVVCGRRKGTEHVIRVVVTMEQARTAQWTKNEAYAKTPQDMLWARAASRVCDRIASDVLKGIASVEEIRDTVQATAEVGNGRRTVTPRHTQRAAAVEASAVEEPPLQADEVPGPAAEGAAEPAVRTITQAQQRKLHALLREHEMADREVALVWISGVLEREIGSTKDLSVEDAATVIDALETQDAAADDPEPTLDGDDWPEPAQPGGAA